MFGLMQFRATPDGSGDLRRHWRLHYCGSCKTIGREYGQSARLLLNHDAVFLAELLTALAGHDVEELSPSYRSWNCAKLPGEAEIPAILRYTAAATVLLSEYKVRDHELDSGHKRWIWIRRFFSRRFGKARGRLAAFGFPVDDCDRVLSQQGKIEARSAPLDVAAVPTAEATALVFRYGARIAGLSDNQTQELGVIGYRFGVLIYLLDAWEDFENDARIGAFNALRLSGVDRDWGAKRIRADSIEMQAGLAAVGCPRGLVTRLHANVESRLAPFTVLQSCRSKAKQSLGDRWRCALVTTRHLQTSAWSFAAVLGMAFLFPAHARSVRSSSECLSLGLNAMAVGGLIATVKLGGKKGTLRSMYNSCCGGWLGELDCDCCCDSCCDSCCEGCCSCDCG